MKLWILGIIVLLVGCQSDKTITKGGHWGERSSWAAEEMYTQGYYSDTDGHKIGEIYHGFKDPEVEAKCSLQLRDPGYYETDEDAQKAVEEHCKLNIGDEDKD